MKCQIKQNCVKQCSVVPLAVVIHKMRALGSQANLLYIIKNYFECFSLVYQWRYRCPMPISAISVKTRVVNGPTSSGPNPARTQKYKSEPGPNPKANLKPKSCPKKPES